MFAESVIVAESQSEKSKVEGQEDLLGWWLTAKVDRMMRKETAGLGGF